MLYAVAYSLAYSVVYAVVYAVVERELAFLVVVQGESIWKGDQVEGTVRQVFIIDR